MRDFKVIKVVLIIVSVLNLIFIFGFNGEIPNLPREQSAQAGSTAAPSSAVADNQTEEEDTEEKDSSQNASTAGTGEEEQTKYCRVIASGKVNMRKGPGTEYEVVQVLLPDTVLVVTGEEENGWRPVRTEDEAEGYVFANLIIMLEDSEENPEGTD